MGSVAGALSAGSRGKLMRLTAVFLVAVVALALFGIQAKPVYAAIAQDQKTTYQCNLGSGGNCRFPLSHAANVLVVVTMTDNQVTDPNPMCIGPTSGLECAPANGGVAMSLLGSSTGWSGGVSVWYAYRTAAASPDYILAADAGSPVYASFSAVSLTGTANASPFFESVTDVHGGAGTTTPSVTVPGGTAGRRVIMSLGTDTSNGCVSVTMGAGQTDFGNTCTNNYVVDMNYYDDNGAGKMMSVTLSAAKANGIYGFAVLLPVPTVSITVTSSSPTGSGYVTVDGTARTTPYVTTWNQGSPHTIAANGPVSCGANCQYAYSSWSDGGAQSHSVTAPTTTTTYTAYFTQQYYLTMSANPGGGGTLSPGSSWQNAGASVPISATANANYAFATWSGTGSGSYSGSTNAVSITMNAAVTETANFNSALTMTVSYAINGGGSGYSAPVFNYVQGGQAKVYTLTATATGITVDTGSAWSVTANPLGGSGASERWQTTQTLSGTAATGSTIFTFYHQYLQTLSYSVPAPAGSGYSAPTYSANRFGSSAPQTVTTTATGYWYDASSAWSITNPLGGSSGSEQWATAQTVSGTVSSATTSAFTYQHQYYFTLSVSPAGGGTTTPATPGSWENAGANVALSANANANYAFSSWTCTGAGCYSGTSNPTPNVAANNALTETANFNAAVTMTVSYTANGGGSPTAPTFNYVQGGSAKNYVLTATPTPLSVDTSSAWSVTPNPLGGSTGTEQWITGQSTSGTSSTTSIVFAYPHQYMLTVQQSPPSGGTTTPDSGWQNSGAVVSLTATQYQYYAFASWVGVGSGSYTGTSNPASATMNGPITDTANFNPALTMTLSYAVVGGGTPTSPSFNYVQGGQAKVYALTVSPTDVFVDTGSSWYVTPNPLGGSTGTEQWITGQTTSGTVAAQTLVFTYQHGYYLAMAVSPNGAGTTTPNLPGAWQNAAASVVLNASPSSGYAFSGWTCLGTGCYSGSSQSPTVQMSGALNETATFILQITMTVSYQIAGGGSPSAPVLQYVQGGQARTATLTTTPTGLSVDPGTPWSVTANPLGGSGASERWETNQTLSGTTAAAPYTFTFYHQYLQTLSYSVPAPAGSGYSAPTYSAKQFGIPLVQPLTPTPTGYWFDSGATWALGPNPLTGSTGTERWSTAQTLSGTINSAQTQASAFQNQYSLTLTPNPSVGGTVSPSSGWQNAGGTVQISATANTGYVFAVWSGDGTGEYSGTDSPATVTMNGPITETAAFDPQVSITIDSSPSGSGFVTVDGTSVTAPQTFTWTVGSTHTLAAASTVTGPTGTQYIYEVWSDAGSQTHTITVPGSPTAYTATYKTQYQLTIQVSPPGGGTTVPGAGTYWYDSGAPVSITQTASSGYSFGNWTGSGAGSYSGSSASASVTMNGPLTEAAEFASNIDVSFNLSGAGSDASSTVLTVDGASYSYAQLPRSWTWATGSTHSVSVTAPIPAGTGKQYAFTSWTNGGGLTGSSGTYTTPTSSQTVTANFKAQYELTVSATPSDAGTASPTSGWRDAGSVVQLTATPSGDSGFASWAGSGSGSYTGTSNPASATMNGPITEEASFGNVVVDASGAGGNSTITIDGTQYPSETPRGFSWNPGSTHTISVPGVVDGGNGTRRVFTGWTDGDGLTIPSGTYTVPPNGGRPTANYKTQYELTTNSSPPGAGTWTPATGWADAGAQVTLSATAANGYNFTAWSGTGSGSYTGSNNPCENCVTVSGPITETAEFALGRAASTVINLSGAGADAAGTVVTIDGTNYASAMFPLGFNWTLGTVHSVSATPTLNAGAGKQYVFGGWTNGGSLSGPSGTYTATAAAIVVLSYQAQYQLTISATAGGTTNPTPGTDWHDSGSQVSVTATPQTEPFSGWILDGAASGTINPATVTMDAPHALVADFSAPVQLTVAVNDPTMGTTSPAPGTATYQDGALVPVTANPTAGHMLTYWVLDGQDVGTDNPYSVLMNGNHTLNANFGPAASGPGMVTITSDPAGQGYVQVDGSPITTPKAYDWTQGERHNVTAASQVACGSGCRYVFTGWSDGGAQSHTVTVASGPMVLTATYKKQYALVMQDTEGDGSTTPSSPGTYWYDSGGIAQVDAVAGSGDNLDHWVLDGSTAGSATTYNVPMTATHGLKAVFTGQGSVTLQVATNPPDLQPQPIQNPSGSTFRPGTMVSITAAQIPGWTFKGFTVVRADGTPVNATVTNDYVTFTMPASNVYVRAMYGFANTPTPTGQTGMIVSAFDSATAAAAALAVAVFGALAEVRRRKKGIPPAT